MMYFKTGITRRIKIHPKYSGGKYNPIEMVKKMLKQDICNNPFSTKYGYIVSQIGPVKVEDGYCLPLTGFIEYLVTFEAILLYPTVGEVIDATVEMVTNTCIVFRHVCIYGLVRSYHLNDDAFFKYEEPDIAPEKKGKSVESGLFRSQTDPGKLIERGTVVRVRITQRNLGGNGFFLVGSMSSKHLGPLRNQPPRLPTPEFDSNLMDILALPGISLEEVQQETLQKSRHSEETDEEDNESLISLQPDP